MILLLELEGPKFLEHFGRNDFHMQVVLIEVSF